MTESNIYLKIARVILDEGTQTIAKSSKGYTSDDVYAALRSAMAKNNLVCIPSFNEHYEQDGNQWVSFTYTLIDADSGEKNESTWYQIVPKPNGMMTIDKCIGAASTYAHKYFLMRTFMLTSSDDPKIDNPSARPAPMPKQRTNNPNQPQPAKVDSAQEIAQMELQATIQAKTDFLNKLLADTTLMEFYNHKKHVQNALKIYAEEFGNDPMQDGFAKVVANLINRKTKTEGKVTIIG